MFQISAVARIASISLSTCAPVKPERGITRVPRSCGRRRSASSRNSRALSLLLSMRSHLLRPMTSALPSFSTRSASVRSCFSNGMVASSRSTTTSAKRTALSASATASFSTFSTIRDFRRRPAVSKILSLRPFHSASSPIESRVMPGSGPVSRRSWPRIWLMSVDLPAFGRPSTAMRRGLARSSSLPSSSSPRTSGSASFSSSGSRRAAAGRTSTSAS